jgi:hypothetical protein
MLCKNMSRGHKMESDISNNYKLSSLDVDKLKDYVGKSIQLMISYKEHECSGNLEDGENESYTEKPSRSFSYPLLNILMQNGSDSTANKYLFILSSNEGRNVLIPFKYEVTPFFSLRRFCKNLTNTIESIVVDNNSKLIPESACVSAFCDGAERVTANDYYTSEDASELEGLKLAKLGCKYDMDKHIITGDIGNLVNTLIPAWR